MPNIATPTDVASCDLTFACILFKLIKSKSVQFPPLKEDEKELQVHHRFAKILFPSEYKNMLPVNSSHTQAASNLSIQVLENTLTAPLTPFPDRKSLNQERKSNFAEDFKNETISPTNSKNR